MPWSASRFVPLLVGPLLVCACAGGSDDGLSGFTSAAYTAGPDDTGGATTGGESEDTNSEGPQTTAGSADGTSTSGNSGGDGGNPLCCQPGGQPGCESEITEACVCTSQPSCCQNVWSQECVDLAIACGDPFCTGDSGTASDTSDTVGTDSGGDLECDPGWGFSPGNPAAGVPFTATYTDGVGLTWVGMYTDGPGGVSIDGTWGGVTGGGPFTWSYGYDGLAAGVWTFVFTHRETENGADIVRSTCEKQF